MTEERLEEVKGLSEKAKKHFGVYSVGHRLKLYYGEAYGLNFDSTYEEGTLVKIHIPYQESGNVYD